MLDIHCHFVPEPTFEMLHSMPNIGIGEGRLTWAERTLPLPARLGDAVAFECHRAPLDFAVVSPPPGLFIEGLLSENADYATRVNADLRAAFADEGAVAVLGWLPLDRPESALEQIRVLRDDARVVGVTIGTGSATALVDPDFDAVWQELADAGLSMLLHPDSDPYRPDAKGTPNPAVLGFPAATAAVATSLLLAGDGFWRSGVRLCLVHGGGFLALAVGRLLRAAPSERAQIEQRLSQLWTDDLVFGAEAVALVESTFAPGHVMTGSDWPFAIGLSDLGSRADWREALRAWSPRASDLLHPTTEKVHEHG